MFRYLPFPFEGGSFPPQLGVVVQRTVLDGVEPAREVTHADDGSWMVGDGVNDPNEPGACLATHMSHVTERDSSVALLAELAPGQVAKRGEIGDPWVISAHEWPDD